jgi:MFS transporter, DHA1 family, tetracycline resistance protein
VKPAACQAGSDEAQAAAAYATMGQTVLALVFNPVFGHLADICGRRRIMICSILLSCIPASVLLLMQVYSVISPTWYFMTYSLIGVLNFLGIAIAALSDNVPEEYRAPTYGLLLCVFYGALATGPTVSLLLGHLGSTIVSLSLMIVSLITAMIFLPETLSQEIRLENIAMQQQRQREQQQELLQNESGGGGSIHTLLLAPLCRWMQRPFQDIAVLNRSWTMRLVAAASFLESMVFAGDSTLFIYYVEDRLDMRDSDIARIFIVVGMVGCLLQGGALQPLVQVLGEKKLLLCAFAAAATHNFFFGAATVKWMIYIGVILGQVGKLNFAILASFASKGVSAHEQGLVQGALAATNSIGSGIGPLSMQFVYNHTKNKPRFGPGFMFVYAGLVDMIGIMLVALIPSSPPSRHAGSSSAAANPEPVTAENVTSETCINSGESDLEERLLET